MSVEVKVPRISVNDDFVEIVEWCVADGSHVGEGSALCVLETSKSTFEITAERNGYIRILAKKGERIPIQDTICLLRDEPDGHVDVSIPEPVVAAEEKSEATRKAVDLAEELGVDLSQIEKQGIIREKDVREFHTAGRVETATSPHAAVQSDQRSGLAEDTGPRPQTDTSLRMRVLRTIQFTLQPPLRAVMWVLYRVPVVSSLVEVFVRTYATGPVGSEFRTAYYRNGLTRMGKDVRIDSGAQFVAPGSIEIGDNAHIDADVKIVAGTPERPVRVGRGVHIGPGTIIHGTGGVTIGDYAAVAAGSVIYSSRNLPEDPDRPGQLISMSHAAPPDMQRWARDAVTIEDYAFIGLNVCILPGVTVGRGAIVNSGAVVANDVPAYSIFGGPTFSVIGSRQLKDTPTP